MNKQATKNFVLALLVSLVFLSACNSVVETPTPIAETQTLTVTATKTVIPTTMVTATLYPTREPTLTRAESEAYFMALYQQSSDCELPCVWGITPGQSTEEDVKTILSKLDYPQEFLQDDGEELHFGINVPEFYTNFEYSFFNLNVWLQSGLVSYIAIPACYVNIDFDYSLSGILQEFGPPDEIIVTPAAYDWESPTFTLKLFFHDEGIIAHYNTRDFQVKDHELEICVAENNYLTITYPNLILFSPENIFTLDQIYDYLGARDIRTSYSLNEIAFSYSPIDFYYQFSSPGSTGCIALDEESFVDFDTINN